MRSDGVQFRTSWHQDEPYWSVEGFDTVSIWMPLMDVEKRRPFHLFQDLIAGIKSSGRRIFENLILTIKWT